MRDPEEYTHPDSGAPLQIRPPQEITYTVDGKKGTTTDGWWAVVAVGDVAREVARHLNWQDAETHRRILANLPPGYDVSLESKSYPRGPGLPPAVRVFWKGFDDRRGDPPDPLAFQATCARDAERDPAEVLGEAARAHAAGADVRRREEGRRRRREAQREKKREQRRAERAGLATEEQVARIMELLPRHHGGGWYDGPTRRSEVKKMTAAEAQTYIWSLEETSD